MLTHMARYLRSLRNVPELKLEGKRYHTLTCTIEQWGATLMS